MFRSATTSDLDVLLSARPIDPVVVIDADRFHRDLALGHYRLEWSWLHEVDGRLLARALWWGPPDADHPASLDCVWVDPDVADRVELAAGLAAGLVQAGHQALREAGLDQLPDLNITVPTDWKEDAAALAAVEWRARAVAGAGLTERIERFNYAWTPNSGLPQRSSRLTFRPADDRGFLDVFAAVALDSLDKLTVQNLAAMGADAQAADDLEFYLSLPGDRGAWRIAYDHDGGRVGFIIPSRSAYDASVSYLGVVPEQRGRGYVDDLLAEITHVHAEAGAERITGTTDSTNAPMAAAFLRGGYAVTAARVVIGPAPTRERPDSLAS
jgi:ribosomal protein S18 acetylase RimI-like enzyme